MVFPWFFYGLSMVFLWFSHGYGQREAQRNSAAGRFGEDLLHGPIVLHLGAVKGTASLLLLFC